jgi:hypothetical protein
MAQNRSTTDLPAVSCATRSYTHAMLNFPKSRGEPFEDLVAARLGNDARQALDLRRPRGGALCPVHGGVSAKKFNPVIRPFAERLRAAGKAFKVIVVACMRKLLTVIKVMLRENQPRSRRTALSATSHASRWPC